MAYAQFVSDMMSNILQSEHDNSMMRNQHSHDIDMFNMQKAYNNEMLDTQVTRKMGDLRRAGLSPAFLNGSQIGAQPLGVSPSSTSAVGNRLNGFNLTQGLLADAEIKNLGSDSDNKDSDTEVKRLEAERKKIENQYLPALKQREVSLLDGNIKLTGSNINYTDEQCKNLAQQTFNLKKECDKINAQIDQIRAQVQNLEPDTVKKWLDAYYATPQYEAIIKQLQSQAHLNYTQADDLVKTRVSRIFGLNASALKDWEEYNGVTIQNGQLAIDYELDNEYKETERKIDLFLRPVRAIADVIGSFAPFATRKVRSESNVTSKSTSNVTSNVTSNSTSKSENHNYNHTPHRTGKRRR